MKITTPAKRETKTSFDLQFRYLWDNSAGFSFPCSEQGAIDLSTMTPAAIENYQACLSGVFNGQPVESIGVHKSEWTVRHSAIGQCDVCNAPVELDQFTNTCACGAEYNSSGQRLSARPRWGYETDEQPFDCI